MLYGYGFHDLRTSSGNTVNRIPYCFEGRQKHWLLECLLPFDSQAWKLAINWHPAFAFNGGIRHEDSVMRQSNDYRLPFPVSAPVSLLMLCGTRVSHLGQRAMSKYEFNNNSINRSTFLTLPVTSPSRIVTWSRSCHRTECKFQSQ